MKENKRPIVIDGVTEVDDLTLVSHFAQTEVNKIQELRNFKIDNHTSSAEREGRLSHFFNDGDGTDSSDSEVEGLVDILSPRNTPPSSQSQVDRKDPLDNLRIIDTVDLPDKVSENLPISRIGRCKSRFDDILVIESLGDSKILDLGSIVCKMDRTILGTVNDTFGQTTCPYYMVILRNKDLHVEVEEYVYCDLKHSTFVTDQNFYSPPTNNEESEDEKMEEVENKGENKLKQSYKDL